MPSRSLRHQLFFMLLAVAVLFGAAPAMGADDVPTDAPFIIGGSKADPGEWQFTAALVNPGASSVYQGQFCGGALIAPKLVLTAAHCVDISDPSDVSVVTGITDLAATPKSALIAVTDISVHPDWNAGGSSVGPNDLAMLTLASKAPSAPVALADPASATTLWPAGALATAIGWGATNVNPTQYPTELQELSIEIVSDSECVSQLGSLFDPVSNLCAGEPGSTNDGLCFGDSGGPVVVPDGNSWLLVGLTSWGLQGCAAAGKPDVFTEVANFTDWIAGFFSVTRYAGTDRYSTAAIVSNNAFPNPVPVAYVATGLDFPDALAASAAAGARGGPVLLTDPNLVPTATKNELKRLAPAEIVLVGGSGVVSKAVLDELRAFAPIVGRTAGSDRFTTAEEVSKGAFAKAVDVVYIATGFDFPDALSAGAAGGFEGGPILLTSLDTIPTATLREIHRLKPKEIVVVGGIAVISDAVVAQFNAIAPTTRAAGSDRFATAAAVSARVHVAGQPVVYIATGLNFPDALAAAATAAATGAPLLLTSDVALPSATKTELKRLTPAEIVVVGGSSAVSQSVIAELTAFTK